MILKVMLEDIPRHGPKLAEELRRVGAEIKKQAEKELAELYPKDSDGATPIAYLWARTVRCESPDCGAEIPLMRSFWLCKKTSRKRALRFQAKRQRERGKIPEVEFEIFEPKNEREVQNGTVTRAKASCPGCNMVLGPERVRAQLAGQRGGADVIFDDKNRRAGGARMFAVVLLRSGDPGRDFRLPTEHDYDAVHKAQVRVAEIINEWERGGKQGLRPEPDEPLPPIGTLGFRVQRYGILQWGDLFTARQKAALIALCKIVARSAKNGAANEIAGLALSRLTDIYNAQGVWETTKTQVRNLFSRQAIAMRWDFAEASGYAEQAGDYQTTFETMVRVAERLAVINNSGQVQQADAAISRLPSETVPVWFTDPPYYDAIPYSDLSDFFYVWLKRALPNHPLFVDPFDSANSLTPKLHEAVQDETNRDNGRVKDRVWFEETMAKVFAEGRRVLREDGVGSVVFAHKTTEGWEALLSGMIRGGWTITGSWPIATEMATRMRARESAALATSVHLVCRPRSDDAPVGDWGEVHRELPKRVAEWIERLQSEHIRGADLVFACIGPALEIYSKYSKVVDAEDREIPLGGDPEATEPHKRGYLAYVWEAVGRAALEQVLGTAEAGARNGAAGAIEEDARLTALFLWTLQSTNGEEAEGARRKVREEDPEEDSDEEEDTPTKKKKGLTLVFDVVRRFAQPLGIHLDNWEDRIIETDKGIVRLLPVAERGEQLFGQDGADLVADRLEREPAGTLQLTLFAERTEAPRVKGKRSKGKKGTDKDLRTNQEATTLDRVHAAMLLQASGRTNALRALLQAEQDRGPDFLRLANALSALYPKTSEEKRLLDAMLLAVPR
jgi:hypothetical protein